jgi:hypothetical protein
VPKWVVLGIGAENSSFEVIGLEKISETEHLAEGWPIVVLRVPEVHQGLRGSLE